jgi:hypothetical protein
MLNIEHIGCIMEKGEKQERLQKNFPKLSDENQQNALDFAQKLWRQEQGARMPVARMPLATMPVATMPPNEGKFYAKDVR